MRLFQILLLSVAVTSPLASLRADERAAQDIRELMSPAEYQAAGLDKLTEAEREALNIWLYGKIEAERVAAAQEAVTVKEAEIVRTAEENFGMDSVVQAPPKTEAEKREQELKNPGSIESRIAGSFRGWSGSTVFVLENGQVWKQAEAGELVVREMQNPRVTLQKGMLGAYFLKVEGYGSRVKVRRIK